MICGGFFCGLFMHLTPSEYIPWFGSTLAEIVLLAVMLHRHCVRRFPFFFASIAYDFCREVALFVVFIKFRSVFFAGYWLTMPIEYTLAFAVIYEAFQHAFKADIHFSPIILKVFWAATALLVVVAAAFVLHPGVPLKNLTMLFLVLSRSSELLRCGLLLFLWVFAARLGISFRHYVWGIVFGLGMYSGVSLIVVTFDVATGKICGHWLVPIPQFAYFAATLIWTVYFLRKEPARAPLTLRQLHSFRDLIVIGQNALTEIRRLIRDKLWSVY
jgi:hypothetical protein